MIRSSASDGHKVLENTVNGIKNLAETVIGTSGTINSLGESSKQIIEIVKVISDIADQTNLLALNAAIEAARAGEHGRGFAVVADEVRKLAERTVTATAEINEMTSGISKDVNRSVQDMQAGAQLAKEGEDLASELQASLEGIIHGVVEAAEKIESVSAAITQQNESSRKISEDSSQIAGFSKNNAEIAASNRQQSEMLKELASGLQLAVEKFRLKS
jgi:methyl-accepting chemotaxis protein